MGEDRVYLANGKGATSRSYCIYLSKLLELEIFGRGLSSFLWFDSLFT